MTASDAYREQIRSGEEKAWKLDYLILKAHTRIACLRSFFGKVDADYRRQATFRRARSSLDPQKRQRRKIGRIAFFFLFLYVSQPPLLRIRGTEIDRAQRTRPKLAVDYGRQGARLSGIAGSHEDGVTLLKQSRPLIQTFFPHRYLKMAYLDSGAYPEFFGGI